MNTEDLWEQYLPLARSVASGFTFPPQWQEDAQAEAESALWRACTTYDSSKSASFPTYARTVVWKQVRDFSRYIFNPKRTPNDTLPLEWYVHIKYDDINSTIDAREIMLSLSEVDRVLYLCCICGYKHRELAGMFGVSRPVISRRISKSRKELRRILIEKGILKGKKKEA